ncbi:hypothetical protein ACVWXU_005796 [Streptomyces sp. TE33382]
MPPVYVIFREPLRPSLQSMTPLCVIDISVPILVEPSILADLAPPVFSCTWRSAVICSFFTTPPARVPSLPASPSSEPLQAATDVSAATEANVTHTRRTVLVVICRSTLVSSCRPTLAQGTDSYSYYRPHPSDTRTGPAPRKVAGPVTKHACDATTG